MAVDIALVSWQLRLEIEETYHKKCPDAVVEKYDRRSDEHPKANQFVQLNCVSKGFFAGDGVRCTIVAIGEKRACGIRSGETETLRSVGGDVMCKL